jgi:hypothetical protein
MSGLEPSPHKPPLTDHSPIWSLDLLTKVQTYKAKSVITGYVMSHTPLLEAEIEHLKQEFISTLESQCGVKINPAHLVFHKQDADFLYPAGVKVSVTWHPQTHEVLFPEYGNKKMMISDLGVPTVLFMGDNKVESFTLSGWHEQEDCWVFSPSYIRYVLF